ncbi:MAG: hypothetical protein LBQ81_01590 [Zoogloeaceae bacterium]|jgi:hypothetical protein|nr:hypothetical protein [Zoogloeaceae bacterium]
MDENKATRCESCKINPVEIEFPDHDHARPYRLCRACLHRLENHALRPLEFFNLASIHGATCLLGDDFYDTWTGEAGQPRIEVEAAEQYPFPTADEISRDVQKLMDYACSIRWDMDDWMFEALRQFDQEEIFRIAQKKIAEEAIVTGNPYTIIGKIIGAAGGDWAREEWQRLGEHRLLMRDAILGCLDHETAFQMLIEAVEASKDGDLAHNTLHLWDLHDKRILDWIEKIAPSV